ncbi:MAG: DegT/DnrJ/EryC1/StrS family aminotransferase [Deltaproteobacteria bacterium]|jgi:dTDP-4-amino-4,6-dideoxygalactose transaminase|nr:DegT/DnrJ/EryC1/StrS family aminotransferase [Deltaproteobacteria bacterium]
MKDKIFVTRPWLPPLNEILPYLENIWNSRVLTNEGRYLKELETNLAKYLQAKHVSLLNNGTIALLIALQSLGLSGEVVTTPFSFVATTHCLSWLNLTPVFADIEPNSFNLDPAKVEAAITKRTSAILGVHCYGRPCDVVALADIAKAKNVKLIYDAAHAFGVKHQGRSVMLSGDLSAISFHATKVFNTFEGGAVVSHDDELYNRINLLKNFGIQDESTVADIGLNGKMNEFCAALGLVQLDHIGEAIVARRLHDDFYRQNLANIPNLICPPWPANVSPNYAYFPILVEPGFPLSRDGLYEKLTHHNIFVRRYFYPLISEFSMYHNLPSATEANLSVASSVSRRILCLPIYPDLSLAQAERVVGIIADSAGLTQWKSL